MTYNGYADHQQHGTEKGQSIDWDRLREIARIPEFEGESAMAKSVKKQLDAEKTAIKCPTCHELMMIVEYGDYLAPDGKRGDYVQQQCQTCGYTLHSYEPPNPLNLLPGDDIPF